MLRGEKIILDTVEEAGLEKLEINRQMNCWDTAVCII